MGESDDDVEYEVRKLRAEEELVIDGETAVDDLLVAQRIAQLENSLAEAFHGPEEAAKHGSAARPLPAKQQLKNNGHTDKLRELMKQARELSKKISELPSDYDELVDEDVREACSSAFAALERAQAKETSQEEDERAEEERAAEEERSRIKEVLDGLDLESTSEEEGLEEKPQIERKPARHQPRPEQEAEGEGEDAEEDDDGGAAEGAAAAMPPEPEWEGQHLMIRNDTLPEQLGPEDEAVPVGEVSAVIDGLVVVRGDEDSKALDLQSVICLEDDLSLVGVVVDVFGLVTQPYYLVLPSGPAKKSEDELQLLVGIRVVAGMSLPESSYLTDNVDIDSLRRQGLGDDSDCSEEDECIEDDESSADDFTASKGGKGRGKRKLDDYQDDAEAGQERTKGKGKGKNGKKGGKREQKGKEKGRDAPQGADRWSSHSGRFNDDDDNHSMASSRDLNQRSSQDRTPWFAGGRRDDSGPDAPPWRSHDGRDHEDGGQQRGRSRSPRREASVRRHHQQDSREEAKSQANIVPPPPPAARGSGPSMPPPPPAPMKRADGQHVDAVQGRGGADAGALTGKWSAAAPTGRHAMPPAPPAACSSSSGGSRSFGPPGQCGSGRAVFNGNWHASGGGGGSIFQPLVAHTPEHLPPSGPWAGSSGEVPPPP
eukprot:CAMPEP_0178434906 /NCGR_PEP_ID=MMETSP0689_2-20121128/33659_1 /TAXON_ID=160604 /ORGANISM="Amphidinium massartii, Strain CS-259" /LENGTH=655 /DNA_ID=CAMNT_0020056973 /DNA_START=53 /DNA_END=2016 /DNA_ORIENTATION=+